jgi:hypothetical protein
MTSRKIVFLFFAAGILFLETPPACLAQNQTTPATNAEAKIMESKRELLKNLYDALGDIDDVAPLGLTRMQDGQTTAYTLGGKPLNELDEDTLNDLEDKTSRLFSTNRSATVKEENETREDIQQMQETLRLLRAEQDRRR